MPLLINLFRNLVNISSGVSWYLPMLLILFQSTEPRYEMENLLNSDLGYLAYIPLQLIV